MAYVERRYEVDAGYARYHEYCSELNQTKSNCDSSALDSTGYELIQATSERIAGELRQEIVARFDTQSAVAKSKHLSFFGIDDPAFEYEMLEKILTPAVDQKIVQFLGSQYFVYWATVSRSVPVSRAGQNSFLWHCDRGPQSHLKLLYYLNAWQEHGGGTSFLDLETTQKIAISGYVFASVSTRVGDLTEIGKKFGAAVSPWSPKMKAGSAVLFRPSAVLHRGMRSTHGPRDVATLCFLPSPIPWREARVLGVRSRDRIDGKWHEDAAYFRNALGPATR
jgi:hypothetical protein